MNDLITALHRHVPLIMEKSKKKNLSKAEMRNELEPIRDVMCNSLDPEKLLQLSRTDEMNGPSIGKGIHVKAIHEEIEPPRDGVRYIHIEEREKTFSVGIFVFPPGYEIPLHDHPGMTVLSLVLYGKLSVKSFDIIDTEEQKKKKRRNGSLRERTEKWFTRRLMESITGHDMTNIKSNLSSNALHTFENEASEIKSPTLIELYPCEGNVHQFIAGPQGAAVLDVLVPPYDVDDNRDCTFYKKRNESDEWCESEKKNKVWLVPMVQPDWFQCLSGSYLNLGGNDDD